MRTRAVPESVHVVRMLLIAVGVLLASPGCDNDGPGGTPKSKISGDQPRESPPGLSKETWDYWDAMHKAAAANDGPERLKDLKVGETIGAEDLLAGFQEAIEVERARCRTISALPVLHVDPELTEYAAQCVQARLGEVAMLEDLVALANQAENIVSGPRLMGGLLLNLMQHANDEEGALWNATTDQAADTAAELKRLKPAMEAINLKVSAIRDARIKLRVAEMQVRTHLSQRFSKEFPSISTYLDSKPLPMLQDLTPQEIQRDLAGRTLTVSGRLFEAPNQIVSFSVQRSEMTGPLVTFHDVQVTIKGKRTRMDFPLHLKMVYHRFGIRWKLMQVEEVR